MSEREEQVNRHAAELLRLTMKVTEQGPEPLHQRGEGVGAGPHRGQVAAPAGLEEGLSHLGRVADAVDDDVQRRIAEVCP